MAASPKGRMTEAETTFRALVQAVRAWERHMDQWEKFRYVGEHGPVYVTIRMEEDRPETFDLVDAETGIAMPPRRDSNISL